MTYVNSEDVYKWYVEDVVNRNNTAMEFKKQIKEFADKQPIDNIKEYVKQLYALERKELGERERKTYDNDFDTFKENIRVNVIFDNFTGRPETKEVEDSIKEAQKNKDFKTFSEIIDKLYSTFSTEIIEKKLEEKVWRNRLINKATEMAGHKLIAEDFEAEFDPLKVNGNCTKGITVSLYRATQKFGLPLYQTNQDKEDAAHPKTLAQAFAKYVKKAESGLLKDIEDIQIGDIVLLSNTKGELKHAMMVSSFNEQGEPLLLGFTSTQRNIQMFESKRNGDKRKGIIIDVKSFIHDRVEEHNRQEISQIMFGKQKTQTR